MQNIEVSESEEKRIEKKKRVKTWAIVLPLTILVVPLIFLLTIYLSREDPVGVVETIVVKPEVKGVQFDTFTYGFGEDVPEVIVIEVNKALTDVKLDNVSRFEYSSDDPQLLFTKLKTGESSDIVLLSGKLLVVTDYFSTKDSISSEQLADMDIVALEKDSDLLELILSGSAIETTSVTKVESYEKLKEHLSTNSGSIGLITPEDLDHTVKLMTLDEQYYLDDPQSGYISASIGVVQNDDDTDYIVGTLSNHFVVEADEIEVTPEDIFKLRMTGVTAISRNLAISINNSGDPGFGATLIGDFLADADLTHTSNEVSFVPGCVPEQSLRFCSNIAHYETLKNSGIDIIELTGNHNNDFGAENNAETIQFYTEEGLQYFGGGLNSEDASKILYLDQDGTKVAMIGYNWFDSVLNSGAIASENRAGANRYSSEILKNDIATARENADVVIVDFQFEECYAYPEHGGLYPYCYKPLGAPDQRAVFREAADAGADIVIGTQAHQPQTFEVYNGKLIFYGLGNIFFDQISWIGTRQGLVLTHYFIDGEHVQTKIDTTLYDIDMRPYLTYGADREYLLDLLNDAR